MTSKERMYAALERKPVDRIPIYMWFHPETTKRMARLLEIPRSQVPAAFGDDVRQQWVSNNQDMAGLVLEEGQSHKDIWGIEWKCKDSFNQISHFPLEKATNDEILAYQFPVDKLDHLLGYMKSVVPFQKEYFIGCDVSPCVFEMYWRLRGMENGMTDLVDEPEIAADLLQKCGDFNCLLSEAACEQFPLDWLWTGDDVAGQHVMMMSLSMWREMVKPHLKKVFDIGKKHDLWIAYHCCGALRPIIPDLIEMGLDVLNPVQGNCPGMDPFDLKKEFGRDLAFMGGVDTQDLLPNGTEKEVRMETARLIEGMTSDGGGYILAAAHTIPPETRDENIFAMYDVAGLSKAEIFDRAAAIRRDLAGTK